MSQQQQASQDGRRLYHESVANLLGPLPHGLVRLLPLILLLVVLQNGVHNLEEGLWEQCNYQHHSVALGQLRRSFQCQQGLVGLEGVFVVVGVPLELEHEVVREAMGSVPGMPNVHFLILPVGQLLPLQAVVFKVVD